MKHGEPFFWMQGILATELAEITSDPGRIDAGDFWVVNISFEGTPLFARFANVQRNLPFPPQIEWRNIDTCWQSSFSQNEYENYVEEIRARIADGLVYQVNACRILTTPAPDLSLASLFIKILDKNPSPLASFLRLPNVEIACASPELFLRREEMKITTSPIKGTQPLGDLEDFGTKDQSENIMIVDLMRNDLSRICEVGTVKVGDLLRREEHPGLRHLVSDVHGILKIKTTWKQIFEALMPPGSVSGAPKSSALKLIEEWEGVSRGNYCGTIGWIEGEQSCLSVAIRTFWKESELLHYGTGAGITWGSSAPGEWRETQLKANHLLGLAGGFDEDGWQYGSGIFETLLIEDGHPLLFSRHMDRAESSGKELGLRIPPRVSILAAIKSAGSYQLGRVRLSFGNIFSLTADSYRRSDQSLRIQIINNVHRAGSGPHKRFPFQNNLDLLNLAKKAGFDEVLLIDKTGLVGEGATCNYVFYIDGLWVTPALSSGVLPGIMRALAIENSLVIERQIMSRDLPGVQAMMALSSLRIATPITLLDQRSMIIGSESKLFHEQLLDLAHSHSVD